MRNDALILFLFALAACDGGTPDDTDLGSDEGSDTSSDTGSDTAAADIAIAGTWLDDYGNTHVITNTEWTMSLNSDSSLFAISQYDNDGMFAIAQNDAANPYSAGLWSRFDWTVDADSATWFCQTAYDAADEAAALAATPADSTSLDAGCGGFAWSMLTAQ